MKKIFVILLLIVPVYVQAQRFNGGILFGITASQIDGDRYAGYNKGGLTGGVFVNTSFSNNLIAQMELKYIGKGAAAKNNIDNTGYYRAKLQYIELPLLLKYKLKRNFVPEAGLGLGYLFKAGLDLDGNGYYPYDPPLNNYEISMLLGISYEAFTNFFMNARLSYSLVPIRRYETGLPTYVVSGFYNNVLSFSLYYQFGK